jgi:hypothetical protein
MRWFAAPGVMLSLLAAGTPGLAGWANASRQPAAPMSTASGNRLERSPLPGAVQLAEPRRGPPAVIDVNRPRSPFDCSLPIGISWYGSRERCLQYLCGGRNVYNEYIFDEDNRRRKNPCYGQSPTDFGEHFDE